MASSTAVAQDAGAAAAVETPVSSTPVSTGADGGAGGSSDAILTDDQILGITPESTPAVAAEIAPQPKLGEAGAAELSIDTFKPLFAANPQVQSLWDKFDNTQKLVSEFGTVADARKAAETVKMLGGVQHLEAAASRASEFDQVNASFFSGTPQQRQELVKSWYAGEGAQDLQKTAPAIAEMVSTTLDTMKQVDPSRYVEHLDKITRQTLDSEHFGEYIRNITQAQASGQGLDEAVKAFVGWAQRFGFDKDSKAHANSPEAQRLAAERESLNKEKGTWQEQQQAATLGEVGKQVYSAGTSMIDKALGDLKINGRAVFGEKSTQVRKTIADQAYAHMKDALMKNPVLLSQVSSLQAKGLTGKVKELVDLNTRFMQLQMAASIEAVMKPWTDSVVGQANGTAARARAAEGRSDISGGAGSGGSTKPSFTVDKLRKDGYKLSDDDILNS